MKEIESNNTAILSFTLLAMLGVIFFTFVCMKLNKIIELLEEMVK